MPREIPRSRGDVVEPVKIKDDETVDPRWKIGAYRTEGILPIVIDARLDQQRRFDRCIIGRIYSERYLDASTETPFIGGRVYEMRIIECIL